MIKKILFPSLSHSRNGKWNYYTIEKIWSYIGKVKEIHNIKHSFDTSEVTIILDEKRLLQKSLVIKEGDHKYHILRHGIKDSNKDELDSSDIDNTIMCVESSLQRNSLSSGEGNIEDGLKTRLGIIMTIF